MMILDQKMAILDLMKGSSKQHPWPFRLPSFVSRQVAQAKRYFLDLAPDRGKSLTVACGGYEEVTADYTVVREDFPYFCLEWVTGGKGQVWLGAAAAGESCGESLPLAAGTLFSYGPGIPHRIVTDRRSKLRKHYVDFVGRQAAVQLGAAGLVPGRCIRVSHAEEVTEIFDLMLRCGLPQSAHSGALCQQLVGVLLAKVRQRRLPDSRHDDQAAVTFEAFRRLLQERCEEWQSVEAACREYGMTPAYACRLFARFGEHSPYQFLVRQRMSLAAEWLGTEQALVREVAVRLGFADPYQFSRTFKRVFGIAPAAFRRAQAGFTGSVAAEPTGAVLAAQSAKASRR